MKIDASGYEIFPILRRICESENVKIERVLSPSRRKYVVDTRDICAHVLRVGGMKVDAIGAVLKRNHGSIVRSIKKVNDTPRLLAKAAQHHELASGLAQLKQKKELYRAALENIDRQLEQYGVGMKKRGRGIQ